MKRREFIGGLLGLIAVSALPTILRAEEASAGLTYDDLDKVIAAFDALDVDDSDRYIHIHPSNIKPLEKLLGQSLTPPDRDWFKL